MGCMAYQLVVPYAGCCPAVVPPSHVLIMSGLGCSWLLPAGWLGLRLPQRRPVLVLLNSAVIRMVQLTVIWD